VPACSTESRQIQSLIAAEGGPFPTRREADAAIATALRLCVVSSAPPCTGECIARGNPCQAVVDEWDLAIGPFYAAPVGGSGWYYRIPVGTWMTYRFVPILMPAAVGSSASKPSGLMGA
jgi:hypothetical protein